MTTATVDNTVLSNFAHAGKPELLHAAFDSLIAPPAVMNEYAEGVRLGRVPSVDWSWLSIVALTAEEQSIATEFAQMLGQGEAECIAVAQARRWMVLTDDREARHAAKEAGVLVSGTLGALMNLVQHEILTLGEGDKLLAQMKQHGYRCPVSSLADLDGE